MPAGDVEDAVMDEFDAMPAGPSGPAQPGVMPPRRVGLSRSAGRHRSAAHPVVNANSKTQLMTSKAPTGSG
jgi:hypothetical protein